MDNEKAGAPPIAGAGGRKPPVPSAPEAGGSCKDGLRRRYIT